MTQDSAISEEMRQAIGGLTLPEFPPEDVTRWAILRYAAATEDPNPLWRDEQYARQSKWHGIVAPPTFVEVYSPLNRIMREVGGELVNLISPFTPPFERQLLAGEEFEFYLPVRPGDAISGKAVLGDVWEGQSRSSTGRLVFMREDKDYRNRKGELVSTVRWTRVFVENPPPTGVRPPPPAPGTRARPAAVHPVQVYFDNVEVDSEIPSMEKHVTMTTIAKWAGATGDVGTPHFDHEYAQEVYGLPGVVAHGALSGAYLAQLVTNWIGPWGALKKHSVRYVGSTWPRDILTLQGRVVSRWQDGGERLIECETWAQNQHGTKVTLGRSIASLPSRKSQS